MAANPIPEAILKQPIEGVNLRAETLEALNSRPQLWVFLRHFGCIFCREMVGDLRDAVRQQPDYPQPVFFYQGSPRQGREFFERLWPEATAVADPKLTFYKAMGLGKGGLREMFGGEVWSCGLRAMQKGHFIGQPVGDPWVMPGLFYVDQGRILWQHDFGHAGDHPDVQKLGAQLQALKAPSA